MTSRDPRYTRACDRKAPFGKRLLVEAMTFSATDDASVCLHVKSRLPGGDAMQLYQWTMQVTDCVKLSDPTSDTGIVSTVTNGNATRRSGDARNGRMHAAMWTPELNARSIGPAPASSPPQPGGPASRGGGQLGGSSLQPRRAEAGPVYCVGVNPCSSFATCQDLVSSFACTCIQVGLHVICALGDAAHACAFMWNVFSLRVAVPCGFFSLSFSG